MGLEDFPLNVPEARRRESCDHQRQICELHSAADAPILISQGSCWLQEDGSSLAPKEKELQKSNGILMRVVGEPRHLISLVRTGKASSASMRCVLAGVLALGFVFVWSVLESVAMVVLMVPWAMITKAPMGNDPIAIVLTIVLSLPGLIAAAIAVVAPLLGAPLGLVGLFQRGNRLLGAVGVGLNILLMGVLVVTVIGVFAFAG